MVAVTDGGLLFAKNSDRDANEAQLLEWHPTADHVPGEPLRCTWMSLPQVSHTHAVVLSRPWWMWGAEMGANEHGVAIGNEAVHARIPPQQEPALLGMDLLRLALQRAASATKAVETIIELLEQHGQGGNCGHLTPRHYHNSFLVADPKEAFVLETVGRMWVVQRATDVRAISNAYTIGRDYDRISPALLDYASIEGWRTGLRFDVAESLSNLRQDAANNGRARCTRSTGLLQASQGKLDVAAMIGVLRDHGAAGESDPQWHPQDAPLRTVCMHAADGERTGQTVNSMVSELQAGQAVHWVTGTAAPCLSIFKPVLPGVPLPAQGPRLKDKFDPAALWWRHEKLHRGMLADFSGHLAALHAERDALGKGFRARIAGVLADGTVADRARTVAACWAEADAAEQRWATRLLPEGAEELRPEYRAAWTSSSGAGPGSRPSGVPGSTVRAWALTWPGASGDDTTSARVRAQSASVSPTAP